ncbi:DNA internalization-related competence protein ComEC/Rec2 [Basilea psittacipulmonis]|uniref:Metallo-beta-lactamase domain-containing protein n=2 Tax=Basilea TaxID=1472344 RepID=A0A077DHI3_9BURK|nr:DNA internalization-related competence protein ComEC/Rec2 [Basilea psittacipulmonis]AIL32598.1 hypothetical protein IX83_04100 [Basilea psittacipulmonis DSM 24701]
MFFRLLIFAVLICIASVQLLPDLYILHALLALGICVPFFFFQKTRTGAFFVSICILAFLYSHYRAWMRLEQRLDAAVVNQSISLTVKVISLPVKRPNQITMMVKRVGQDNQASWPEYFQLHIKSSLYESEADLEPCDEIALTVSLRPIHALQNFHAFDYEQYAFAHDVLAVGQAKQIRAIEKGDWSADCAIDLLRQKIKQQLSRILPNKAYQPIMIALVVGDQASITQEQWNLFNISGITHLVSISGSHITMLCTMVVFALSKLGARIKRRGLCLGDYININHMALVLGLMVACFYCFIAGWGIPAQRTFFMLAITSMSLVFMRKVALIDSLLLAALGVLLWDPWAVLASGFYLSFIAVAILFYASQLHLGFALIKAQLVITFALIPILIFLYHQVSLISPIANALAIPLIGFIITPLSLLLAILSCFESMDVVSIQLAALTYFCLESLMIFIQYLADWKWALIPMSAPTTNVFLLSLIGMIMLALPWKKTAILLMIPLLTLSSVIPVANWQLVALDVGQGSAIIIREKDKVLLYDTGIAYGLDYDMGKRVILPYLQAKGIDKIDVLVLSHSDNDHVGGLISLLENIKIEHIYASFQVDAWLALQEANYQTQIKLHSPQVMYEPCDDKQSFNWENLSFRFLNHRSLMRAKSSNDDSCVLWVQDAKGRSALLLGDVSKRIEKQIIATHQLGQVSVLMAAHHGSKTSSSRELIEHLKVDHVVFQSGFLNRFKHPHFSVWNRWKDSHRWANVVEGAIEFNFFEQDIEISTARKNRYWSQKWLFKRLHGMLMPE